MFRGSPGNSSDCEQKARTAAERQVGENGGAEPATLRTIDAFQGTPWCKTNSPGIAKQTGQRRKMATGREGTGVSALVRFWRSACRPKWIGRLVDALRASLDLVLEPVKDTVFFLN